MSELNAVMAVASRDLLKFMRDPGRIVAAVVFPFVMIAIIERIASLEPVRALSCDM